MDVDYQELRRSLQGVVAEMQQVQRRIAADRQPLSLHEIDSLKRLGNQYAQLVERLEANPAGMVTTAREDSAD